MARGLGTAIATGIVMTATVVACASAPRARELRMTNRLAEAEKVARRDGASALGCPPGETVAEVKPGGAPFVFNVKMASGRWVQALVVDGKVARARGLEVFGRWLREVEWLETRKPELATVLAVLGAFGEPPPGEVIGLDPGARGPHGEEGGVAFAGSGGAVTATITLYGNWNQGDNAPDAPVRARLVVDATYAPRWVTELYAHDGRWVPWSAPPRGGPDFR